MGFKRLSAPNRRLLCLRTRGRRRIAFGRRVNRHHRQIVSVHFVFCFLFLAFLLLRESQLLPAALEFRLALFFCRRIHGSLANRSIAIRALRQSVSVRALVGFWLHFNSTPSSVTRSSMRSSIVIGGTLRGEHAALPSNAAQSSPKAKIRLLEYGIWLPRCNGTQNRPRCDPIDVTRFTT